MCLGYFFKHAWQQILLLLIFLNFGEYLVVSEMWCGNVFSTSIPHCNFGGIKVAVKRGVMIL